MTSLNTKPDEDEDFESFMSSLCASAGETHNHYSELEFQDALVNLGTLTNEILPQSLPNHLLDHNNGTIHRHIQSTYCSHSNDVTNLLETPHQLTTSQNHLNSSELYENIVDYSLTHHNLPQTDSSLHNFNIRSEVNSVPIYYNNNNVSITKNDVFMGHYNNNHFAPIDYPPEPIRYSTSTTSFTATPVTATSTSTSSQIGSQSQSPKSGSIYPECKYYDKETRKVIGRLYVWPEDDDENPDACYENIIIDRKYLENSKEVSDRVIESVRDEFAVHDKILRGKMSGLKKVKEKKFEWVPSTVFKAFTNCKTPLKNMKQPGDPTKPFHYWDYTPRNSCFGKITMRQPNAWTRSGKSTNKRIKLSTCYDQYYSDSE